MPTNDPASEGNARKRNPPVPTASATLSINRCGWEAGACDEEAGGVGVDGVDAGDGVLGVDAGTGAGVDVEAGAAIEPDAEP